VTRGNSTWPNSRQVVACDLGDFPAPLRAELVREAVSSLYNIPVPSPVQVSAIATGTVADQLRAY